METSSLSSEMMRSRVLYSTEETSPTLRNRSAPTTSLSVVSNESGCSLPAGRRSTSVCVVVLNVCLCMSLPTSCGKIYFKKDVSVPARMQIIQIIP